MSSRNAYLSAQERKQALVLSRSLKRAQSMMQQGENCAEKLIAAGKQLLAEEPAVRLDYFEVVDPDTLDPVSNVGENALIAVAAYVGTTRLIDNLLVRKDQ